MRSVGELKIELRKRGRKVTPQRLAVFDALLDDDRHPSADLVWERVRSQMPTVSQRTVYQVLNDLVELGEVQPVAVGSGATRFDPNVEQHDHFVCNTCERIFDVAAIQPRLRTEATDYRVDSAEVIFRGQCGSCLTDNGADLDSSHMTDRTGHPIHNRTGATHVRSNTG